MNFLSSSKDDHFSGRVTDRSGLDNLMPRDAGLAGDVLERKRKDHRLVLDP